MSQSRARFDRRHPQGVPPELQARIDAAAQQDVALAQQRDHLKQLAEQAKRVIYPAWQPLFERTDTHLTLGFFYPPDAEIHMYTLDHRAAREYAEQMLKILGDEKPSLEIVE